MSGVVGADSPAEPQRGLKTLRAAVEMMVRRGVHFKAFNMTDFVEWGYTKPTSADVLRSLLKCDAITEPMKHTYVISDRMKELYCKEVSENPSNARIVLFDALGMERMGEEMVDEFLTEFKELWRRKRIYRWYQIGRAASLSDIEGHRPALKDTTGLLERHQKFWSP